MRYGWTLALGLPVSACSGPPSLDPATIFDFNSGTGFVAGPDAHRFSDLRPVAFTVITETQRVRTWMCDGDPHREITALTSIRPVASRPEAGGFRLTGYEEPSETPVSVVGPEPDTCPAGSALTAPAGEPALVSEESRLFVDGRALVPR
jgi:hypothetical protein